MTSGVVRDPRLAEIDLRGKLYVHELELSADDDSEPSGNVFYVESGAGSPEEGAFIHYTGRSYELIAMHPVVDLVVTYPGFRAARRNGVRGEAQLHFERGFAVRLVLPSEAQLPSPPLYLKATLVPADVERSFPYIDFGRPRLRRAPGSARALAGLGTHEGAVALRASRRLRRRARRRSRWVRRSTSDVAEHPGEQRIELTLDAEALAAVLADPPF